MDREPIKMKTAAAGDADPADEPEAGPAARNRLLALGAAAVMMVYAAGYDRTREGAQRFTADNARAHTSSGTNERRSASIPQAPVASSPAPLSRGRDDNVVHIPRCARNDKAGADGHCSAAAAAIVDTARAITAERSTTPAPPRTDAAVVAAAPVPPSAPTQADTASKADVVAKLKDGTYSGWGTSRHGDIEASVVIANGRIMSASITQCLTRYSCSWISPLPPQVVTRQSAEVDSVSGATQSSNAFYTAIFEALKLAK